MEPPHSITRQYCHSGAFSEVPFTCVPDCPRPLDTLQGNEKRATLNKSPNAFFLINYEVSEPYTRFSELINKHPYALQHGSEYQLMCQSASDFSTPYRVRAGKASTAFQKTFLERYKFGGTWWHLIMTSGFLLKQAPYMGYVKIAQLAAHAANLALMGSLSVALFRDPTFVMALPNMVAAIVGGNMFFFENALRNVDQVHRPLFKIMYYAQRTIDLVTLRVLMSSKYEEVARNIRQRFHTFETNPIERHELWAWTKTTALIQYYGFFCKECVETTMKKMHHRKTGHSQGPWKRVKCVYGQWTDSTFSCETFKDFTAGDPQSTICIMCSQAWRNGRAAATTMEGDAHVGKFITPRWFMKGYHAWAPHVVRTLDRMPFLQDLFPIEDGTLLLSLVAKHFGDFSLRWNSANLLQNWLDVIRRSSEVAGEFLNIQSSEKNRNLLNASVRLFNCFVGFTSLIPLSAVSYLIVEGLSAFEWSSRNPTSREANEMSFTYLPQVDDQQSSSSSPFKSEDLGDLLSVAKSNLWIDLSVTFVSTAMWFVTFYVSVRSFLSLFKSSAKNVL
eukprot:GDKK01011712.1.p1 GENE.GDKK01011712.1~~GDKK01011712.1.p1  ORF type:complete len:583 (+),score=112.73 GDKK01011712.1:70-1749(+)